MKLTILISAMVFSAASLMAQSQTFTANVRGQGDSGKCTIEVVVDGVAEVYVRGTEGTLRTLSGAPARWVRFDCNAPFPPDMRDFRWRGIDGRGRQELRRDPRENRGTAVVYIADNKGGEEGYTFDLEWKDGYLSGNRPRPGSGWNNSSSGGNSGGNSGGGSGGFFGGGNSGGGFFGGGDSLSNSTRLCQEAITSKLRDDGYRDLNFGGLAMSDRSGKRDWMVGEVRARGRYSTDTFDVACRMDSSRSRVVETDHRRR
ncbi:MAG: hypothetical protein JNL98_39085 [Bryobacterales bacterium]|nr:hypothetical protein [Bryobacterales bacterium]